MRGGVQHREHHGFFSDAPCLGCQKPLSTPDPTQRLCPDCHEEALETLAHQIDPGYDPAALNGGDRLWEVLGRLYGPCFGFSEDIDPRGYWSN